MKKKKKTLLGAERSAGRRALSLQLNWRVAANGRSDGRPAQALWPRSHRLSEARRGDRRPQRTADAPVSPRGATFRV